MTTKQASKPVAKKPLVTDTLMGQCENRRNSKGITINRCPNQGSLREITGGLADIRVKLCDACSVVWANRDFKVRTVTAIEVRGIAPWAR